MNTPTIDPTATLNEAYCAPITTIPKPAPRVTRIQIGRLHNLGNYEHVRYEIALEIPEGASAGDALTRLERILAALSPRPPKGTPSRDDLYYTVDRLKRAKGMLESAGCDERPDYAREVKDMEKELAESAALYDAWQAKKSAARKALDDMGGVGTFKDAKEHWDDEV